MRSSYPINPAYVDPVALTTRFISPPRHFRLPHYVCNSPAFLTVARQGAGLNAAPNAPRKSRRKTSNDVQRDRKNRARSYTERRAIIAEWSGAVVAESSKYEVRV